VLERIRERQRDNQVRESRSLPRPLASDPSSLAGSIRRPRYNEVIAIIDKKMKGRLDSPLHLTAYLLNPYYSYGNPSIFDDATITEGFISYVETFYHHDEDKQDQAVNTELDKFRNREGPFNKKLAKTCGKFDYNPGRGNSYYMVVSLL